jgi:glycosyltransferase involved in cell wall biosynthesis
MPRFSLITPHFQRPALLAEMVRSVQQQTLTDWELLIVDDQSSQADWEAIQQHSSDPRVRLIRRHTGLKGPNTCRNLGLELSLGEFVIFLDSDDLLAPWCLEQRLAAVTAAPECDFWVFQALIFERSPGDRNQLWNNLQGGDDTERFLSSSPPWCMTSPIWRRTAILALGGLDPLLRYGTDSELHTRALIRGLRYQKYPDSLPDVFVRRDDSPRFNRTLTPELFEAQLARVAAGRKLLSSSPSAAALCPLWDKQYFACLEFFIFNAPKPRQWTGKLLADWRTVPGVSPTLLMLMAAYSCCGSLFRRHAYFLLRIARRLVLLAAGHRLLQQDTGFHNARLTAEQFAELERRLSECRQSPSGKTAGLLAVQ